MFTAFIVLFIFCELGQRITNEAFEGYLIVLRSDWYTFPTNFLKLFPIFMHGVQRPIVLCGIGKIACTRDAFKVVWPIQNSNIFYQNDKLTSIFDFLILGMQKMLFGLLNA